MNRQTLLLVACSGLLAACSGLWNVANRASLKADVAEVLSLDPGQSSMRCAMVGSTRSGACVLPAERTQVDAWVGTLGLSPWTISMTDLASAPPLASEGPLGCLEAGSFVEVEGLPAYWIGARPDSLALESGGQFEYMLLIFDAETSRACVQVSYAYG